MGWLAKCSAASSSSKAFLDAEDFDSGSSSQLEINIISAQNVKREKFVAQMHTYAVAWIREDYKLKTHVVSCDDLQPYWNAYLHFIVSDALLNQEKGRQSALTVEIYCQGRLRDTLLGTVRVLLSNLSKKGKGYQGAQSLALQIRRPSGRPQGILNIGSIIHDLDSASMINLPPSLRNPNLLDEEQQKPAKLAPLREFQEMCRRSFSVSRDDLLAKEKISSKFALDDNSLHKPVSLALMEAVSEDEDEEELAMEAIYRKLKALSTGRPVHGDTKDSKANLNLLSKPVKSMYQTDFIIEDSSDEVLIKGCNDEPSDHKSCDDYQLLRQHYADERVLTSNSEKINKTFRAELGISERNRETNDDMVDQRIGKTNKPVDYREFWEFLKVNQDELGAKKQDEMFYDSVKYTQKLAAQKKESLCEQDKVFKINQVGDSVVFVWDPALHKKNEDLNSDKCVSNDFHRKPNSFRAIWARRASWALRKGAAKIHLSPSDK
ncbi:hypothetical protein KP509_15G066200 [Ceratopteris richardii]|uniref:C2 domain-containing protein n=1 Tax=Ceratopteris richardii TaxID=49495 RepID=A0A8T2T5M1_CERRI|nr:hypothetical protein KP509_15G066200 [Ceratopteris richardii]